MPGEANAENFSLKDFFKSEGDTLMDRVKPFSDYFRETAAEGLALYSRELVGPASNRVRARDPLTGQDREMLMFGSNNYLGLAAHPYVNARVKRAIDEFGVGMGGPPLLNGMSTLHRELEQRLARLKGAEDALLFASGYQANLGWVNGLLRDGDILLFDELNHASLYDGIRMASQGTRFKPFRFRHNDTEHLSRLLRRTKPEKGSQVFVAVEGVYSMDGDLAPLPRIRELCDFHGASLVVDDAHGTGVMGPTGGGTAQHFGLEGRVDLAMGTFSKAFGTTGGFLCGRREVIDYLRFFARSYMFSAALPPPVVAAVLGGLDVIERDPSLIARLHDNVRYFVGALNEMGFQLSADAAIVPIPIPARIDIRALSRRFHEAGVFINSVEYPAVPRDEQRLRVSLMATHTDEDLDLAINAFRKIGREFGLI